jgi:hypothetical protein
MHLRQIEDFSQIIAEINPFNFSPLNGTIFAFLSRFSYYCILKSLFV